MKTLVVIRIYSCLSTFHFYFFAYPFILESGKPTLFYVGMSGMGPHNILRCNRHFFFPSKNVCGDDCK